MTAPSLTSSSSPGNWRDATTASRAPPQHGADELRGDQHPCPALHGGPDARGSAALGQELRPDRAATAPARRHRLDLRRDRRLAHAPGRRQPWVRCRATEVVDSAECARVTRARRHRGMARGDHLQTSWGDETGIPASSRLSHSPARRIAVPACGTNRPCGPCALLLLRGARQPADA